MKLVTYSNHKPSIERGDWCGEIVADDGEKIYHGPFSFHALPKLEHARLFAAAPELLAACEHLVSAINNSDSNDEVDLSALANEARAAIKKAKGE